MTKEVYVFSDSAFCLGKIFENTQSNDAWEDRLTWLKSSPVYRNFDRIDGEPMSFFFPKIQHVAAQSRSSKLIVEIK